MPLLLFFLFLIFFFVVLILIFVEVVVFLLFGGSAPLQGIEANDSHRRAALIARQHFTFVQVLFLDIHHGVALWTVDHIPSGPYFRANAGSSVELYFSSSAK